MHTFAHKLAISVFTAALAAPAWSAVEIKGARFQDTYQLARQPLQLNGAGVRVKFVIDVYAAGLYVPRKEHSANALIAQPGPKSMQIVLLRDLTGEDFADAMVKGFKANNTAADQARFQARLDEIRAMMVAFGTVKKGSNLHIDFTPGVGVQVLIDGVAKGTQAAGEDFFAAVLRIWLGPSPVDSDLKDALVGTK